MTVSVLDADETLLHTPSAGRVESPSSEKHGLDLELDQVRAVMQDGLQRFVKGPANTASQYQIGTRGSLMRARLALASCKSFQCSHQYAIVAAASCELIHNASLVHDDLLDGDSLRRGQPTVWKRHGKGVALCAGDLLLCSAFGLAADLENADESRLLTRHLAAMAGGVIVGQSIEVAPRAADSKPGFQAYLEATRAKTVPLIKLPLLAGAIASDAHALVREAIAHFAEAVGLAYQIIDDLDDLVDSQSGKFQDPGSFHPFHAWHHHRGRQKDSPALRIHKATRHAQASLQRARRQLKHLEVQVALNITPTLGPLLVSLERRAHRHRDSANLERG